MVRTVHLRSILDILWWKSLQSMGNVPRRTHLGRNGSSKSKNKKKQKDTSRLHSPEGASVSDIESFNSDMSTKNGFTDKETLELSQAFSHFDKNHDGKISSDELASVIKILRFNISESEVEEMIRIVDKNENGFVDYDEYLSLMRRFSKNTPNRDVDEKTLEAFRVFDLDGNGFIDRQELQCVMKTLGENLSEDDVKEMFSEADLNGDGKIDYKEFSRLISHLS
ncbi:neo-calmodulin-like isoform X2 [Liolophura sinensis]|uniref:neo-calmodulin-like isoform X2 n=1 Tax=Liolophura sinensis TaxID=3198878 RepID=UPI0031584DA0